MSAEEEAQYTRYIDDILNEVNLETVTRKAIRAELENKLGGKDLTEQKVGGPGGPSTPQRVLPARGRRRIRNRGRRAKRSLRRTGANPLALRLQAAIKQLIEARFDAFTAAPAPEKAASASPPASPKTNGHGDDDGGDDDGDEIEVSVQPPKKKQRKSEDTEDSDAKLAAMLQAQENRMGRSTRGGGSKGSKAKPVKKKPRKKSSNKVKPEDDSDVDGSEGSTAKPRKAGGGFQKPFNLSAPLSELCGGEPRVSQHRPAPVAYSRWLC